MAYSDETQTCETCGNSYDKCITVTAAGATHIFDCFECAIEKMAPRCGACGCTVIGHGTEVDGRFYCCAHCARQKEQINAPSDRVEAG